MVASIKHLLVDDLFRHELSNAIAMLEDQHCLSETTLRLDFDEDGNIITLNQMQLEDSVCHKLSYLIGSINFHFNLVADRIAEGILLPGREEEMIACKKQVVLLAVDLLLDLSKTISLDEVSEVIERIYQRKLVIKEQLSE